MNLSRISAALLGTLALGIAGPASAAELPAAQRSTPLRGSFISRGTFPNPHAHIPAQCYVETSYGTQNACATCHTDGVAKLGLGNNNPQAGLNPNIGNLQAEYAFGVFDYPQVPTASVNRWTNTLNPGELSSIVQSLGEQPDTWDMQSYVRQDNWQAAYDQRPKTGNSWDSGVDSPFRLLPALSPADLPAQGDGFVRSADRSRATFADGKGLNTGWRAINFMPYGIFTPMTGSVSGVYIRLAEPFMQNEAGEFDLATYQANLELVTDNIQDRLKGQTHYLGRARTVQIVRGQYPLGTELAHPLHYVDVEADGTNPAISRFPGTRSERVKEIRWMYKQREWRPDEFGLALKEESAPVYASRTQGWIENGAGWLLGGWIEDKGGALRPQTPSELTQCAGCHSGNSRQSDIGQFAVFTSGTGNTTDSTWALPRKFRGAQGWREMDYLGYRAAPQPALKTPEPRNRYAGVGEYRFFLDHVVGASLYGEMPSSMDAFLGRTVTRARGYSADWPSLSEVIARADPNGIKAAQELRQKLMREFTARGEYLTPQGTIRPELFIPEKDYALAAAQRYRNVVVSQRYDFGKDVFPQTPFTFRYFRTPETAYPHLDGTPYRLGELITDRPVNTAPADFTYGIGTVPTLIDEDGDNFVPDYVPLLE